METQYEKRPASAFWYMLGGAVVGTVAGILLAPKAGRETREDLQEWRRTARERARRLIERIPGRVKEGVKGAAAEELVETKERPSRHYGA